MRRIGLWAAVAGAAAAALSGFLYLDRDGKLGTELNAAPYAVWAAVGGAVLICGTVLYTAGTVITALGVEEPSHRRARASVPSRSHYD